MSSDSEPDDSDIEIEDAFAIDGLKKGFLLEKPLSDGGGRRPGPQAQNTHRALDTRARHPRNEEILEDIKYLKSTYGPAPGEEANPTPTRPWQIY
jgi:hypothetical protein